MEVRVNIKIFGSVQGVFFRRSAKLEAEKLGIVGWVKNDGNGSVEAMAQGERDKVDEFIKWCKKGPPFAKVEKVEVKWLSESQDFDRFDIL
ncbi:acylphosphatase [Candidatus Curtissbacteria bacterium RIFCSPLOWO2_01_FULL_41_18]|uniref:Acylphosphatase n=2 Tax=Candidatus Curtissiibacteriota TaxID=1752717 RepID=A0A1F5G0L0_9BACT|nr:MAG: acylphosphatase [Candidatus Curtissbacteria bacterium RIFCSPHIGHO2_01_FULL_41_13]OGE03833.1 MAG: acylphosphatase [Candidatus Curtissbacteria bacterium RIFCSPLOWO2_01_FULL_41_18]